MGFDCSRLYCIGSQRSVLGVYLLPSPIWGYDVDIKSSECLRTWFPVGPSLPLWPAHTLRFSGASLVIPPSTEIHRFMSYPTANFGNDIVAIEHPPPEMWLAPPLCIFCACWKYFSGLSEYLKHLLCIVVWKDGVCFLLNCDFCF